ncbi:1-acyl-sn-glycerol-3-phosphate acyltransferase [Candidatus Woesearchaeota archaeon]|nr:1-acyl-sn-glycerol-3-phosphate acyltransferase [Candidatus Woesearchaeota archaeon]
MKYPTMKMWLYPFCSIMLNGTKGTENIPKSIPFIVVANHEKRVDPPYIFYAVLKILDKKVHFIATPAYWFFGNKIFREWAGCIPLFEPKQAYQEAKKLVETGEIVGIFPEGRLYRRVRPLKTGALRLAFETKAPILPIGLKSSWIPLNSKLNIGKLIYVRNKNNIKKQMSGLMKEIYKLRNDIH